MLSDDTKAALRAMEAAGEIPFERLLEEVGAHTIRPGMVTIDGGAHYGHHLFPMATQVGATGLVIGFEPIPAFYEALLLRCEEAMRFHPAPIRLFNKALADRAGTVTFHWLRDQPALSGIRKQAGSADVVTLEIETTTIDAALTDDERRRCGFIKLDLEGGEYHALLGATATLTSARPIVAYEGGHRRGAELYDYSCADFFGLWESVGYELFDLFGTPFTPVDWGHPTKFTYNFWAAPAERNFAAELDSFLPQSAAALIARSARQSRNL